MAALNALRRLRRLSSLGNLHGRYSCGNQACQGAAVHCTLKDGSKPHWWSRFRRRGNDSQQAPQDPTACPVVQYIPEDLEPPCVPLIVPPDSPQYFSGEDEDDSSYVTWSFVLPERPSRLSTITEFTESTYDSSSDWHYRVEMVNPRPLSSSETTSSHDEVLEYSPDSQDGGYTVDPDRMATPPSSSAAEWLSSYATAPSHAPAESDVPPKPPNSGATTNNASLRRRSRRRAKGERGDSLEI